MILKYFKFKAKSKGFAFFKQFIFRIFANFFKECLLQI